MLRSMKTRSEGLAGLQGREGGDPSNPRPDGEPPRRLIRRLLVHCAERCVSSSSWWSDRPQAGACSGGKRPLQPEHCGQRIYRLAALPADIRAVGREPADMFMIGPSVRTRCGQPARPRYSIY